MITVAFDCDGTLLRWGTELPRYDMITMFHCFQKRGCKMFIWSHAGLDHARDTMKRLGLTAQCVEKYSFVPDIAFDDEDRGIARVVVPA